MSVDLDGEAKILYICSYKMTIAIWVTVKERLTVKNEKYNLTERTRRVKIG